MRRRTYSIDKSLVEGKYIYTSGEYKIKRSSDYGETFSTVWSSSTNIGYNWINVSSNGKILTVGSYGSFIQQSQNYGNTWTSAGQYGGDTGAVTSNGKYHAFAQFNGSFDAWVQYSSNSGVSFNSFSTLGQKKNYWTAMSEDSKYILVATTTGVFLSTDRGTTWTATSITAACRCCAMSADGSKMLAGPNTSSGMVYTSTDYGATWTAGTTKFNYTKIAYSKDMKYILGANTAGIVYLSTDYGATVSTLINSTGLDVFVAVSKTGKYMAIAPYAAKLKVSSDYGVTWTEKGVAVNFTSVAIN